MYAYTVSDFTLTKKITPDLRRVFHPWNSPQSHIILQEETFFFCAEKSLSHSITDVFVKSKGRAEKREEERETFMIALVYIEW